MKRLLMIAYHFPPFSASSGIQRTLGFARHLPAFGWQPLVLTAHPRAYPDLHRDSEHVDAPDEPMIVERAFALDASNHFALSGRYPSFLARPDRWSSWWIGAVPKGLAMIRKYRPHAIWSTYPIATAHKIGATLHRLSGLPWVADFRDPMVEEGFPADAKTRKVIERLEAAAMRHASRVVCVTPGAARGYVERYANGLEDRMAVIENGFEEQSFQGLEAARAARPSERNRPLTLLHSGIVYSRERDPTQLFQALRRMLDSGALKPGELRVRLRAPQNETFLRNLISTAGVGAVVELAPPLRYRQALEEMMSVDALLVLQAANCNQQVPVKLYEYLRCGRPVLALTDPQGDTARVMRQAGLDSIARLDSADEIVRVLSGFLAQVWSGAAPLPDARYVESRSRRHRTAEFASLLDGVCDSESAAQTVQVRDTLNLSPRFSYAYGSDFFRSLEWFQCLSATAVSNPPRVYDGGDTALVCCRHGSSLHSLTNFYTPEFGPLGDGPLEGIVERIARDRATSVQLHFLREPLTRALADALRRGAFFVYPYFMYENWYLRLQGRDFETYLKARPSRLINTIRRRRKKLAAAHRYDIVLSRDAERIQDFVAVYATSWKRPEPYPEFIPALAQMCASLGILRLGTLYIDGEPAASQFWITTAKKALIYKLAYKDRFRDFSVGSILSLELFRQAIDEDRVQEIDYGVGSEPYKKDWMEDKRQLYGLAAYNLRTASGLALAGLEKAKQAMHHIARRDPAGTPNREPCPN